ncbi:MAG: ferric reductase-like transmembrane domain-containing protein [Patescibacteria group bacterium]
MNRKYILWGVFLLNLAIIIFFWQLGSREIILTEPLIAFGRLSGLLAVLLILIQLILISRFDYLEKAVSLDKLLVIHGLNGFLSFFLIILHPILLIIGYGKRTNNAFFQQLQSFVLYWDEVGMAVLGTIVFIAATIISLNLIKNKIKYEFWYLSHLFLYLAILWAYGHQLEVGHSLQNTIFAIYWYVIYFIVIAILVWYRFLRPVWRFKKHLFRVAEIKRENDSVRSVYIKGQNMENYKIAAGQFFLLRFINRRAWYEEHPFSLSGQIRDNTLQFTIKALGDFSSKLEEKVKVGDPVILDGPHGSFVSAKIKRDKVLMIAGGIGITPIKAMIEELGQQAKDIILICANKSLKEIVFKEELAALTQLNPRLKIFHILSQEKIDGYDYGRLDLEKITKFSPDLTERDIFICGPEMMTKSIIKILKTLKIKKSQIYWEKFSW